MRMSAPFDGHRSPTATVNRDMGTRQMSFSDD